MRVLAILPAIFLLTGCIPVQREYFLPKDSSLAHEERSCGAVPGGGYSKEIAPGVRLAIRGSLEKDNLWLFFQFAVDEGHSLKFESNRVRISSSEAGTRMEFIDEHSGDKCPSLNPTKLMKYEATKLYVANLKVEGFRVEEFTLTLPPALVDSKIYKIDLIEFYLVSKKGVMACIQ